MMQTAFHQRRELDFISGVTGQVATARQFSDLFAYQLLFYEAIADTLLRHRRVIAELREHRIRTQPATVLRESWIGY